MTDIKGYETFVKIEPVDKGWSDDKKYYIETSDDRQLLLRIANIAEYQRKKAEYEVIQQVSKLGIPMSRPVDFGICNGGKNVYTLLTWCEGDDTEVVLPLLSDTEQYVLGLKSGEILRKIHSISAPPELKTWDSRFNRKVNMKIEKYKECGLRFEGDEKVIEYLENNRYLLSGRTQCLQHGDYHIGNMIISQEGELSIIDFNRPDYGDPWEEFNRIVWSASASPYFATGQINGYFGGEPPLEFWKLLQFYISSNTVSSIYWAIPFGQSEVDIMMNQTQDVLSWFDNMRNPVPTWYKGGFCIQRIDDVPVRLKKPFDLNFLSCYGRVFKVFDCQDSGNICFGVESGGKRYFVKFAGAPAASYDGKPEDAIERLKKAVPVYQDLAHPGLIRFVKAEEAGGGYAVVFEWTNAECMGRMYPASHQKFVRLPLVTKMLVFKDILSFHSHIAAQGYIAIDFYDGSIMYDFETGKTAICDIDFYQKAPYYGDMGLWGSLKFLSPEERINGAPLDEVTNVYTMGATAFALFSEYDRTPEKWPLGEALYEVAHRAVSDERQKRQQTIRQFIDE